MNKKIEVTPNNSRKLKILKTSTGFKDLVKKLVMLEIITILTVLFLENITFTMYIFFKFIFFIVFNYPNYF
jgi:hypothetical protein